jgi:alkylation response protein AidB-like acyl-CoA dehydrogenase
MRKGDLFMPTDTQPLTPEELSGVDALLGVDLLSALMRSTWTWDDRALRRDLSALLVDLAAAERVGQNSATGDAIAAALHARAYASASDFVATVLGPKLIADTGNPLRSQFLGLVGDRARFGKHAYAAWNEVRAESDAYFTEHVNAVDYAAPSSWPTLVADGGPAGLAMAMRGYGHDLSDSPFFASRALAWQAVSAASGSEIAADYERRLRSGDLTGTLAAAEQSGSWDPALVRTRAEARSQQWVLNGSKHYVPAADVADVVFVIARSIAGPSLFAVDARADGLGIEAHPVLDDSRPLFGVTLSDTPARLVSSEGTGGRLMSQLIDSATTALAAEQVGLIEAGIGLLRAGPIADNSRLADLVLAHAAATALWQHALADPTPGAAAAAHIGCSVAAVHCTTTVAELRGPDTATNSLTRRALSGSLLFGGPALAHERLLERLGI